MRWIFQTGMTAAMCALAMTVHAAGPQTGPGPQSYLRPEARPTAVAKRQPTLDYGSSPIEPSADPLAIPELWQESDPLAVPSGHGDVSGCDTCCDPCGSSCGKKCCFEKWWFIYSSDHCFDDFISPISNPLFFEDPRTLTELHPVFAHQNIPDNLLGGYGHLYACQFRVAISEHLSIIGTKDGYFDLHTNALPQEDGFANITAGLKYVLHRDVESQFLVSAGMTYEIPSGANRVFQGIGGGDFHFFMSGAKKLSPLFYYMTGTGLRVPTNATNASQMWYWSHHLSAPVTEKAYLLTELNWFRWVASGNGDLGTVGFEGNDLFNLGSDNVAGNDIVTMAVGSKYKWNRHIELGLGWEFPLTNRRDLLHDRAYADMRIRF